MGPHCKLTVAPKAPIGGLGTMRTRRRFHDGAERHVSVRNVAGAPNRSDAERGSLQTVRTGR